MQDLNAAVFSPCLLALFCPPLSPSLPCQGVCASPGLFPVAARGIFITMGAHMLFLVAASKT